MYRPILLLLARPDGPTWDMGAHEYDSANPPDPPATGASVTGGVTAGSVIINQ